MLQTRNAVMLSRKVSRYVVFDILEMLIAASGAGLFACLVFQ